MENTLYYGDNLDILRRHVKDEKIDLVYLDPPTGKLRQNRTTNGKYTAKFCAVLTRRNSGLLVTGW